VIGGFEGLVFIMLDFDRQLTGIGMAMNVGSFVSTIFKIAIAAWILAVDSDKHKTMLKWQSFFTFIIAGFVAFFSGMVKQLTMTGGLYANATRGN
jgi:hypothetical protein